MRELAVGFLLPDENLLGGASYLYNIYAGFRSVDEKRASFCLSGCDDASISLKQTDGCPQAET